jgi:hypothetical protein
MSILGIGIDIVHLPRMTSLISRRGALRVASRILSIPELSDWKSSPLSSQTRFLVVRYVRITRQAYINASLSEFRDYLDGQSKKLPTKLCIQLSSPSGKSSLIEDFGMVRSQLSNIVRLCQMSGRKWGRCMSLLAMMGNTSSRPCLLRVQIEW